jgi:hypothetical protein
LSPPLQAVSDAIIAAVIDRVRARGTMRQRLRGARACAKVAAMKRALALVFTGSLAVAGWQGCKGGDKSANNDKGDKPPAAGKTTRGNDNSAAPKVPPKEPTTPKKSLPADTAEHAGAHRWSLRFGGTKRESGRSLSLDASGNIFLGGLIGSAKGGEATATIGGDTLTADEVDALVVKLDPAGKPLWARNFGGPGVDVIESVAASPDGGVVVGGAFADKLLFADRGVPAVGADDAFIGKFDADGKRLWAKRFGGEGVDNVHGVAVDAAGNVYATGVFRLTGTFGDTELVASAADAYLFSVDKSGAERWVVKLDGDKNDWGRTLAFAADGSLYWLVEFSRRATIGGVTLESVGNRDWGVIKMTTAGEPLWGVSFGGLMDDLAFRLAIDPAGDLVVTGAFSETMEIGDTKLQAVSESDIFVAKLDGRNGQPLWARSWGDKREDIGAAVAIDSFGNIAVTGMYWNTVDFGGGPRKSNGEKDIFLVKLSPAGEHLWSKNFGGEQVDYGRDVAFDGDDNVLLTGTFYLTANFGGVDLVADNKGESIPTGDVFLLELGR